VNGASRDPARLEQHMQPDMVTVDAGANIGIFTTVLARLVGAAGHFQAFGVGADASRFLSGGAVRLPGELGYRVVARSADSTSGKFSSCPSSKVLRRPLCRSWAMR
jgi:hypothetical protein